MVAVHWQMLCPLNRSVFTRHQTPDALAQTSWHSFLLATIMHQQEDDSNKRIFIWNAYGLQESFNAQRLLLRRCSTKANLILPLGEAREGAKHTHLRRQMSAPPSEGRGAKKRIKGFLKKMSIDHFWARGVFHPFILQTISFLHNHRFDVHSGTHKKACSRIKSWKMDTTLLVSDCDRGKETTNCRIKIYRDHNIRIRVNVTYIWHIIVIRVIPKEDCFTFLWGKTLLYVMITCTGYINSMRTIN
jgi:hypothetical protein